MLEQALPEILGKALEKGYRAVVKVPDEKRRNDLNDHLWTYHPESFLPHGTKKDGYEADQPIWLTEGDDNPNKADLLILTGGASSEKTGEFNLCCDMLDGRDEEAVKAARSRWKTYKESGYDVTYWQQTDQGSWKKKG